MCDDVPILIYSHSKQLPTYLRDPLKKKRLVFIDMKDIFSAEFIIIRRRRRGQF